MKHQMNAVKLEERKALMMESYKEFIAEAFSWYEAIRSNEQPTQDEIAVIFAVQEAMQTAINLHYLNFKNHKK